MHYFSCQRSLASEKISNNEKSILPLNILFFTYSIYHRFIFERDKTKEKEVSMNGKHLIAMRSIEAFDKKAKCRKEKNIYIYIKVKKQINEHKLFFPFSLNF